MLHKRYIHQKYFYLNEHHHRECQSSTEDNKYLGDYMKCRHTMTCSKQVANTVKKKNEILDYSINTRINEAIKASQ